MYYLAVDKIDYMIEQIVIYFHQSTNLKILCVSLACLKNIFTSEIPYFSFAVIINCFYPTNIAY